MQTIKFDDIRVGDKIRVVDNYASGDSVVRTFTVKRIERGLLYSASFTNVGFSSNTPPDAYRYWYLVDRPKPTFKVGDTITGAQVKDLPDGAVFDLRDMGTTLRYKIGGAAYTPRGGIMSITTYSELDYQNIKIVFLPEED